MGKSNIEINILIKLSDFFALNLPQICRYTICMDADLDKEGLIMKINNYVVSQNATSSYQKIEINKTWMALQLKKPDSVEEESDKIQLSDTEDAAETDFSYQLWIKIE